MNTYENIKHSDQDKYVMKDPQRKEAIYREIITIVANIYWTLTMSKGTIQRH